MFTSLLMTTTLSEHISLQETDFAASTIKVWQTTSLYTEYICWKRETRWPIRTSSDEAAQEGHLDHQDFARSARLTHGPSISHLDPQCVRQTHETKRHFATAFSSNQITAFSCNQITAFRVWYASQSLLKVWVRCCHQLSAASLWSH